jgi:mannonate dehydratase
MMHADLAQCPSNRRGYDEDRFSRGFPVKITSAKVIVTCPGRNFVTLKIVTDQGVYGIGDATLNGREKAVVAYLEDHVVPCLIGMDPRRIEDIWQYLYKGAYWRRGPVTMRAIAAVDVALWDIKAKMAHMPLYQLLGGRSRDGVMVYGHANGSDIDETVEAVGHYIDLGYKAIRAQTGVPGIKDAYGVGRGKLYYEPADAALPSVTGWDTRKALNYVPKMFEKLREVYGFDQHLLHDGHHRYTPQEAANLARMLEPHQLFWLEDCTPAENQEAFKLVRQHSVTPLAVGEIFNTIWDAKDLIQNQLIDYIRCTIVGAGGVTHLRRIADFAALYQVRTGSHGATDLSPVTMGTALHFDTWVPNFGIQEYMRHTEETDAVFPHDYHFDKGELFCGETPGHGVDIDEDLAAKYPYKPAYLPIARLEDGTMWSW